MRKRVNSAKPTEKPLDIDSKKAISERKLLKVHKTNKGESPTTIPYEVTREDALTVYKGLADLYMSKD